MIRPRDDEILVVHLGGLGDVCLSEPVFFSLIRHFGQKLTALGYTRFLGLFADYFSAIHSIDSSEWLHLFTDGMDQPQWKRIVLIGKDRSGGFRNRLAGLSREDLLFVDMYPDFSTVHVQDHQLDQLKALGVEPARIPFPQKSEGGLILYPEKGYSKQKWPYEKFLEVYDCLKDQGHRVSLLEPFDTEPLHPGAFRFEYLSDVRSFLVHGKLFVSNDCGIAHLAASCGLSTITLFHETDPLIWHPVGNNHPIQCTSSFPSVAELLTIMKNVDGKSRGL